jgi:hypothetical protein
MIFTEVGTMAKKNDKALWQNTYSCDSAEILAATVAKELEEFGSLAGKLAEPASKGLAGLFSVNRPYYCDFRVVANRVGDTIKYNLVVTTAK